MDDKFIPKMTGSDWIKQAEHKAAEKRARERKEKEEEFDLLERQKQVMSVPDRVILERFIARYFKKYGQEQILERVRDYSRNR